MIYCKNKKKNSGWIVSKCVFLLILMTVPVFFFLDNIQESSAYASTTRISKFNSIIKEEPICNYNPDDLGNAQYSHNGKTFRISNAFSDERGVSILMDPISNKPSNIIYLRARVLIRFGTNRWHNNNRLRLYLFKNGESASAHTEILLGHGDPGNTWHTVQFNYEFAFSEVNTKYFEKIRLTIQDYAFLGCDVDIDLFQISYDIYYNNEAPTIAPPQNLPNNLDADTSYSFNFGFQDDTWNSYGDGSSSKREFSIDNGQSWTNLGTGGTAGQQFSHSVEFNTNGLTHKSPSIQLIVRSTDRLGASSSFSRAFNINNRPPEINSITLNSNHGDLLFPDSTITATISASDSDGDPITLNYQWWRIKEDNQESLIMGNSLSPGITSTDLSLLGDYNIGDKIRFKVTPSDNAGGTGSLFSKDITINALGPQITIDPQNQQPQNHLYDAQTPPTIEFSVSYDTDSISADYVLSTTLVSGVQMFDEAVSGSIQSIATNSIHTEFDFTVDATNWGNIYPNLIDTLGKIRIGLRADDGAGHISYNHIDLFTDFEAPLVETDLVFNRPFINAEGKLYAQISEPNFYFNDQMGTIEIRLGDSEGNLLWNMATDTVDIFDGTIRGPYNLENPNHRSEIITAMGEAAHILRFNFNDAWNDVNEGDIVDLWFMVADAAGNIIQTQLIDITKDITPPQIHYVNFLQYEQEDELPWDETNGYYINKQTLSLKIASQDNNFLGVGQYYINMEVFSQGQLRYSVAFDPEVQSTAPIETFDLSQNIWNEIVHHIGEEITPVEFKFTLFDVARNSFTFEVNALYYPQIPGVDIEFLESEVYIDSETGIGYANETLPLFYYEIEDSSATIKYMINGDPEVHLAHVIGDFSSSGTFTLDEELWGNLEDGSYSFTFWAEDPSGNVAPIIPLTLIKDTIIPTGENLDEIQYYNHNPGDINFAIDPDIIHIFLEMTYINSSGQNPFMEVEFDEQSINTHPIVGGKRIMTLEIPEGEWFFLSEGKYQFDFIMVDKAGNVGTHEYYFVKDTLSPTWASISSVGGEFMSTSPAITYVDFDTDPIYRIEYSINGGPWEELDMGSLTINQIIWGTLQDGPVLITFRGYDRASNPSNELFLIVVKDTTIPTLQIGSAIFNERFGPNAPTLDVFCEDNNLHSFYYYYNEDIHNPISTLIPGNALNTEITLLNWNSLAHGSHTITFVATDLANNRVITAEFEIDRMGPSITIISPDPSRNYSNIAPLYAIEIPDSDLLSMWYTIDGSDEISITTFSGVLDQGAWENPPSNISIITFYAQDDLGNINSVSIEVYRSDYGVYFRDTGFAGIFDNWMMPQWVVFGGTVGIVVLVMYPSLKQKKFEEVEVEIYG